MKVIFVTGAAGFIGANLVKRLLQSEELLQVIGIDNVTLQGGRSAVCGIIKPVDFHQREYRGQNTDQRDLCNI